MLGMITLQLMGMLAMWADAEGQPRQAIPFVVPARLTDEAEALSPSQVQIGGWLGGGGSRPTRRTAC